MGTSSGAGNPGELTPKLVAEFQAATDEPVQDDATEDPDETPDETPDDDPGPTD